MGAGGGGVEKEIENGERMRERMRKRERECTKCVQGIDKLAGKVFEHNKLL